MLAMSPLTRIPDPSNKDPVSSTSLKKVRQRASRACLNCRELKIKCVTTKDGNCVRCDREEKTCVFIASRRGGHHSKSRSTNEKHSLTLGTSENEEGYEKIRLDEKCEIPDEGKRSEDISQAKIQNPSDSLNLLANAAFNGNLNQDIQKGEAYVIAQNQRSPCSTISHNSNERLKRFCLVEMGILTPTMFKTFLSTYFIRHHQYMPVLPSHRLLRSDSELCDLAENEPLLAITFVIIASRFESSKIHQACWAYLSTIIQELVLGVREPTLGAIEALLMLSENVPIIQQVVNHKELYELEERFSWNIVGQAVRMSYYLGLDQKTLLEANESMSEETHRMRLIWTYCHLEERQTSIRFGKAFWTRGPTLCFPGIMGQAVLPYQASTTIIPSFHSSDIYSSYTQALIESTNLMSNIHDLLYPSRDRTISLVHQGDYHKILDELTMGFATYRFTWEKKNWDTLSLNETVWVSFNYAKLYAYGFAFEAHMKRTTENSPGNKLNVKQIFPKTLVASPDAKFIIEAKSAAVEILKSCANNLRSYGAMAYLPARYYGYFGHSAVFLIKIIFTGAVCYTEQKEILDLIGKVIECFCDEFKSLDRYHSLIRCAQQLRTLMQTLWKSQTPETTNEITNINAAQTDDEYLTAYNSLAGDVFNLVDNFTFDQFSPNLVDESAEAAVQELTEYFTNDLNSDIWLTYFDNAPKVTTF